ncbi:hypothetical protein HBI15_123850 [Parastagonospora nodorum]|nr:hypothetical protein HBI15_123850 [Parastagonospora nodorum]
MILLQDMHQKSQGLKSPAVLKTVSAYAAPPPPPFPPPPPPPPPSDPHLQPLPTLPKLHGPPRNVLGIPHLLIHPNHSLHTH